MNAKLGLQDIVDMLAKSTSLSKKDADAFFREFFAIIIDNVFNNEPVKIKDFGTFKLTTVDSRETVNVNTGERIIIPSHSKISFTPDKALKTLVNKPFAHFEITPLKDGVSFDIEESDEPAESAENDTAIDEFENAIPAQPEKQQIEKKTGETAAQPTSSDAVSQSFVYTYTSEKEGAEGEKEDHSVTIVVPANNVANETSAPVEEVEQPAEEKKSALDIEIVQGKIDQLKNAIQTFSNAKNQTSEPKPVVVENVEIAEPAVVVAAIDTPAEEIKAIEKTPTEEIATPEPPVAETVVEPAITEPVVEETPPVIPSDNNTVENKQQEAVAEPVVENDDIDSDDYNHHYPDYEKQTMWRAIRGKLTIILFLLAIIGVGSYLIYKIIEDNKNIGRQPRSYENYSDGNAAKDKKVLSLVAEDSTAERDDAIIDSSIDDTPVALSPATVEEDAPNTTLLQTKEGSVVISEHLKINVPNKAAYMQQNPNIENTGNVEIVTEEPPAPTSEIASPKSVTIERGASLLSISEKYYKNRIFWVYIYEENKDKIGRNYDNISAGDKIVLPTPAKYGIDANDPASVAKAKEAERVIHASRRR